MKSTFREDLQTGQRSETQLLEALQSRYAFSYDLPQNRANRGWDMRLAFEKLWPEWATNYFQTLEVKRDSAQTQNLPISVWKDTIPSNPSTKGKLPSYPGLNPNFGLYRTEADFFVIHNPAEKLFYLALTARLKNVVENSPALRYTTTTSIDYGRATSIGLLLFPKSLWLDHFTVISDS